jgi:uncharacterized protein
VLTIGYIAAFGVLRLGRGRQLLSSLEPVGRMALSNYLGQTVIILALLYALGLGLAARLPVWSCLPIGCATFGLQIVTSRLWLQRFRYGPAEWVWRVMTYGGTFALNSAEMSTAAEHTVD